MNNYKYDDRHRIITGTIMNYDGECVANATVILNTLRYCIYCGREIIDKVGYTTTNECGVYMFNIDVLKYKADYFIIDVYNPFIKYKKSQNV